MMSVKQMRTNNTRTEWLIHSIGDNFYCEPPKMDYNRCRYCCQCQKIFDRHLFLDYHYLESGLPNVFISEIFGFWGDVQSNCNGEAHSFSISIPKITNLHESIANYINSHGCHTIYTEEELKFVEKVFPNKVILI